MVGHFIRTFGANVVLFFILFFLSRAQGNRACPLQMPSGKVFVYYHMSSHGLGACGGGGWTLVMKIDGNKVTLTYDIFLSSIRYVHK